jgi:acyl transferase domain-containing protein
MDEPGRGGEGGGVSAPRSTAALFPGQGSSLQGARELVLGVCPELHERGCELVGEDPFARAGESTRFAQPATFLASVAGWQLAREQGIVPSAFAGHSLGELSALTAAGVWSADQGLELVVLRARLMADAGDRAPGGMLALLKGTEAQARSLADGYGVTVANDNAPGQTVLSGPQDALHELAGAARQEGLRAIALDVSAAFHSPAMAPAIAPLARAVRASAPRPPSAPVYSCLTARPFTDFAVELGEALCAPVRWRETVLELARRGTESYLDVGPDGVLAALVRRTVPDAQIARIEDGVLATA